MIAAVRLMFLFWMFFAGAMYGVAIVSHSFYALIWAIIFFTVPSFYYYALVEAEWEQEDKEREERISLLREDGYVRHN